MSYMLSKTKIDSYEGDIIPLVLSGGDLTNENIIWTAKGDYVSIRTFEGNNFGFSNAVLITLLAEGCAQVCAQLGGKEYVCNITIRKRKQADANGNFNFYVGDFHDHTTLEHNHEKFAVRETELISDYLAKVCTDDRMDAMVISDHADSSNKTDFFKGFIEEEKFRSHGLVVFPGAESEVTKIEKDRLGYSRKNSGEIVTISCDNFAAVKTWEEFYDAMSTSPYGICILAHPQIVGWDENGIWNFSLKKNNSEQLKNLVKFIEIGNGTFNGCAMIHEYMYSVALDNGFFVSTTCSSDSHGPEWGYDAFAGKTIIMAPEKSREMFLDALLNRRAYACESGNVKLLVRVNGSVAPCTVSGTDEYDFHVDISYFEDDADSVPVRCEVISNHGETVKIIENIDFSSFDFKTESNDAVYFYLRFIDKKGRRTFSPPVLTGRSLPQKDIPKLEAVSKDNFTAVDIIGGSDACAAVNNDPTQAWYAQKNCASVVIDMGEERKISAFAHYPYRFVMGEILEKDLKIADMLKGFPHKYKVSVSIDGQKYCEVANGSIRVFGQEEIAVFPETKARYVKFEVTETVGDRCGSIEYANAPVCLGELTVFERK